MPNAPTVRVLVVEDEEPQRQLLADIVTALGFSVVTASDGQEALERSVITGHRWWTAVELRATSDKIVPNGLADLVDGLLRAGLPATPVRLTWSP